MNRSDENLDGLFRQYAEAVIVPEASAQFMPQVWDRINARRTFALRLKRVSQVFVGSAAAICLMMSGVMVIPGHRAPQHEPVSYIDVLAEAHPVENLSASGIRFLDPYEASR